MAIQFKTRDFIWSATLLGDIAFADALIQYAALYAWVELNLKE